MKNGVLVRIILFLVFPLMFISMLIALTGFRGPIQLDNTYYNFIQKVSYDANSWKFSIPEIPKIPVSDNVGFGWDILKLLTNFVNFLILFLNIVITIINTIIELITFIVALIKNVIDFSKSGFSSDGDLSYWN